MPVIPESDYRPGTIYRNAHAATILPTLLRRPPTLLLERRRLETADGDFLDVDRVGPPGERTVILCHGLEGNSRRKYMLGMADAFLAAGWSVALMNFRGCSGTPNRLAGSYHAGATDDLRRVIEHVESDDPPELALVGFSMGGNLILKYLGEDPAAVPARLRGAATFSVPVDLEATCRRIDAAGNWVYRQRFLRKLAGKIRQKAASHPDEVDVRALRGVRTLWEFDERFTAPLHGFADARDYYARCSSLGFLAGIERPTLLVNALDDPFLDAHCIPSEPAAASDAFHLETPRHGGHTGFHAPGRYWSERRAVEFISAAPSVASR